MARSLLMLGLTAVIWMLAACARVPIPTSDLPTATATSVPGATRPFSIAALPTATATSAEHSSLPIAAVGGTGTPTSVATASRTLNREGLTTPNVTATLNMTATPTVVATPSPAASVTPTPLAYERNARAILIEADVSETVPVAPPGAHVPLFRLYGDGLLVFAGKPAALSSGLDAAVSMGYLSDSEINALLAYLAQVDFFALNAFYQPRPVPPDLQTARITVYANKAKTVRVYGLGQPGTPQSFANAWAHLMATRPIELKTFVPADGYLTALAAGAVTDFRVASELKPWPADLGLRLADVGDGVLVSGATFSNIATLVAKTWPVGLYREESRVYRIGFAPNLPRSVHMTEWVGQILEAPREFEGRVFDLVGYYRGANLYGEARGSGPAPKTDWVLADGTGAMFVTGLVPQGLDPNTRSDAWTLVRLRAAVVYIRSGTSYLEARRVESLANSAAPVIANISAAIDAAKGRFPELAKLKPASPGTIGASSDIKSFERADGWDLVFWEGWGDCPSGCINNRYTYLAVKKDGRVLKTGEFSRVFISASNSFETTGAPMWGVPK